MDKKVLILGSSGLIGNALYNIFSKKKYIVYGADKELFFRGTIYADITKRNILSGIFQKIQPDIVVLTAALSYVDYCEQNPLESKIVNVDGLKNVLSFLNHSRVKFIFFSSDYIFDGKRGPYSEKARPEPLCVYGRHKLICERIIKKSVKNHLIIRTTAVYGPEEKGKNFVLSLLRKIGQGQSVYLPSDQICTPTYSYNLAEILEKLVSKDKRGTFNIVGRDLISRYEFGLKICSVFKLDNGTLIPVKTFQLRQKARRPIRGGLKARKALAETRLKAMGVKEGLLCLKKYLYRK